jgi:hypothetical protein
MQVSLTIVSDIQHFNFFPEIVIGGFMRIDLYGRQSTQPEDDLYYTVLQTVKAVGLPIGSISDELLSSSMIIFALSHKSFLESLKQEEDETVCSTFQSPYFPNFIASLIT